MIQKIKLFILLFFTFICMTVIGTVSHELGHFGAAKILGYEGKISYNSFVLKHDKINDSLFLIKSKYAIEIKNKKDFPEKKDYEKLKKKKNSDDFWISAGGPLQTVITGTIGIILLLTLKNVFIKEDRVNFWGWILIFTSLFWLRQIANLFSALFAVTFLGLSNLHGDEFYLARLLRWNTWSIQAVTGLLGLFVLMLVIRLIPITKRLIFIFAGLFGGISGFYLWLIKFGPIILP